MIINISLSRRCRVRLRKHPLNPAFLLSISSQEWFDDMYSRLIDRLAERVKIQRAKTASAAVRHLASFKDDPNPPKAILITDPGITDKKHPEALLEHLLAYVRNGGTAVFCCTFSSFISSTDFNQFFSTKLGLPWQFGDYIRTTVNLNTRGFVASSC